MKNRYRNLLFLCMVGILLAGCGRKADNNSNVNHGNKVEEGLYTFEAVILDNSSSLLVIPKEGSDPANSSDRLSVASSVSKILDQNQKEIRVEELKIGDIVDIGYNGVILESYPAQITADTIKVIGHHTLLDGYLAMIDDLYYEDDALNHDIDLIALDTSNFYWESDEQRRIFLAMLQSRYGLEVKEATYKTLVEEGLIDSDHLYFEKGILIGAEDIEYNEKRQTITGKLSKWRSGTGAIGWHVKAKQKKSKWIVTRKNHWIS